MKKKSREEEAWVRGKWMRQEETRECEEVGGWKQKRQREKGRERGTGTVEERE